MTNDQIRMPNGELAHLFIICHSSFRSTTQLDIERSPVKFRAPAMFLTHLTCARCGLKHDWAILQNLCRECQSPLLATYDLEEVSRALSRDALKSRPDK